ncbi:MAG: SpoIIE family protein phosphatase [Tissierellia bacterium]|nr:SpoIIE family protein phosphatase [Tissierellia bacterium]
MLGKTNDKKYGFDLKIQKQLEHIKENWLSFFICFFISRYSIIGELFPFSIVFLTAFCYIKGHSFFMLAVTMISINTVKFNFEYSVMLIAIYLYFYNFRQEEKKPIVLVALYAAIVLICSKTSILIVDGFNIKGLILNICEGVFIFSSVVLAVEVEKLFNNIRKSGLNEYFNRPKKKEKINEKFNSEIKTDNVKGNIETAKVEAASTLTTSGNNKRFKIRERKIKKATKSRNMLNIFSDKAKAKIKEQLLWEGINVKFIEVISGSYNSVFLSVTIKSEKSPEKVESSIIFAVKSICGLRIKCTEKITASPNYYILKFKNVKRVKVKTYVATAIKDGSNVSGDCFEYAGKSDKYYVVLCDGIGSGEEAFNESNGTIDLLSRFLYTDFTEEQILRTLNSLLLLKLDDERFVTIDMQIIDYGSKEVRLYKAGAPPTFIISGGTIEKIEGKSLPMGILDNFEYNMFKRVIRKGDIIIMISDGIIDSINLDEKKSLDKYLNYIMDKDPQTMANSILSYALRGQKSIIDDMTVLVTKIV